MVCTVLSKTSYLNCALKKKLNLSVMPEIETFNSKNVLHYSVSILLIPAGSELINSPLGLGILSPAHNNSVLMIAFITINRGLVPLIEGRCAPILYFRFEIISGLHSQLLLFFFGRKNMLKKKAVSPRSHPAS